jgi:hypothetical protein
MYDYNHRPRPRSLAPLIVGVALAAIAVSIAAAFVFGDAPTTAPAPSDARLGFNLGPAADWGTAAEFTSIEKGCRPPGQPDAPWLAYAGPRDARGWPDGPFGLFLSTFAYPDGDYVVEASGCTLAFTGVGMVAKYDGQRSLRLTGRGGQLSIKVTPTAAGYSFHVWVPGENPEKTGIWRGAFLADCKLAAVIRTLDATHANNSAIVNPSDLGPADPVTRTYRGYAPDETLGGLTVDDVVDLCRRTGATPWYVMPPKASEATWRVILGKFASLGRPVILEACNEPWNSQFADQYAWLIQQGRAAGVTAVNDFGVAVLYATQREVQLSDVAHAVLGDHARVVHSAWCFNDWCTGYTLDYVKTLGRDPAKVFAAVAIAPYFGDPWTCRDGQFGFSPTMTLDQLFAGLDAAYAAATLPAIKAQRSAASSYGLQIVAYEAGQHLCADSPVRLVFDHAQRDPRMGALYRRLFADWRSSGGGLIAAYNYCEADAGAIGRWGLKTAGDDAGAVKWQAWVETAKAWNGATVPTTQPTPVKPERVPFRPAARPGTATTRKAK